MLAQSRSLLDKGFFEATRKCLGECGPYRFKTAKEESVKGGSSRVDYDALVNDESKALSEAKLSLVMKKAGELLPPRGIVLKWVCGQSLIPKILSKVSALFPVRYNICFTAGRIVPGLETHEMAVSFLPQLLDRVLACEGCRPSLSCVRQKSLSKTHRSLFELFLVLFYPLSRMSLSSVARTVQIWNLILSRKKKTTVSYLKVTLTMIR